MFVRKSDIKKHMQGSLEKKIQSIREGVEATLGEGATVLATHDGHAIAKGKDGKMYRVEYTLSEDKAENMSVCVAEDIRCLENLDLDRAASDDLKGIVEEMVSGGSLDCTRVHDLSRMLKKNVLYWVEDVVRECDSACEKSMWYEWYSPQMTSIKEKLYGNIKSIESAIPRARYAKLPEHKQNDFEEELRESVSILSGVASTMVDDLNTNMAYQEEELDAVHQSLREEAASLKKNLEWVEKMNWTGKIPEVAMAHDKIAARLRAGLVVQAHLRSQMRSE